ncbi:MAG: hypothetical protein R3247_09725 [Rhodothermales bacterium]|nr:hypothetical protein [Rhodothermales bacterium]
MADLYGHDDDAWDEHRWEAFLRENDRRVDRYMELMFRFMEEHPRPDPADDGAMDAWKQHLRAFIQEKGWHRDDIALPFFWLEEDAEDAEDEEAAAPWQAFESDLDDEIDAPLDDFRDLPIYRHAFEYSITVLDWANALPGDVKDTTLVQFCNHTMQVPVNIARGTALGDDRDGLGGNIACAKRGIAEANAALDALRQMKRAPYMDAETYRTLYEQAYELRNALGLYIQDLRARFDLGID